MKTVLADLPVWLINLPRSKDRLAAMRAQLDPLNIRYTLFEAVDGKANWDRLRQDIDVVSFERNTGRHVLEGEIGCYHSHLAVWRLLAASDAQVGLVLEDDVVLHDTFIPAIEAAISCMGQWDILKLNKIRAKFPLEQEKVGSWCLNAYAGPATGTGAYLIKRETVQRLLPAMLPITRPIDHEIDRSHVHKIRHFGLEPFPSHVEDNNNSTITGQGFSGLKKFPFWARLPSYWLRWRNLFGKTRHGLALRRKN